jgi:hypothetical protein
VATNIRYRSAVGGWHVGQLVISWLVLTLGSVLMFVAANRYARYLRTDFRYNTRDARCGSLRGDPFDVAAGVNNGYQTCVSEVETVVGNRRRIVAVVIVSWLTLMVSIALHFSWLWFAARAPGSPIK